MFSTMNPLHWFRNKYVIFIATIIFIIIVNQLIIQYTLNKQRETASIVALINQQSLLSQRITKRALYISDEIRSIGAISNFALDSLHKFAITLKRNHTYLMGDKLDVDIESSTNLNMDSLREVIDISFSEIFLAATAMHNGIDQKGIHLATRSLADNELKFLLSMELLRDVYQQAVENQISRTKSVELILSAVILIAILLEFIFLIVPLVRNLQSNLITTQQNNLNLELKNEELRAIEEQATSSLEYISELQKHLEAKERQYRGLIENATDMIYELDESGKFSYVNPVMENLTEYMKEELSTVNYWQLVHPDHKERVVKYYANQRKGLVESSYLEFLMTSKNGNHIWVGQNSRMFFEGNHVWKVSVVARDITDLCKARETVKSSESLFKSLTTNASVGIYQLDVNGSVTFINDQWSYITGLPKTATREQRLASIYENDREKFMKEWNAAILKKEGLTQEFRFVTASKGLIWVINKLSPVKNDAGIVIGYVGTLIDITLIKETQQKVEKSEKLYRLLSENTEDLISLFDAEGNYQFVSDSVKKMLGYEPGDLIGKKPEVICHPDDYHLFKENHQTFIKKSNNAVHSHFRLLHKNGETVWIEAHSTPLYDDNEQLIAIQAAGRDITKRKDTEEALKSSEKRFKLLAENAPIGIYNMDVNGYCTYVNKRWTDITGINQEEGLGEGWAIGMHPDDREEVFRDWGKSIEYGVEFIKEFRFNSALLGTRWVSTNVVSILNENEECIGFIGTLSDITALKEAQLKLKEREKLYRLLADNSKDMIALHDKDGYFEFVSPSSNSLLGYTPEELRKTRAVQIVHPEDYDHMIEKAYRDSYDTFRLLRKDGDYIWVECQFKRILDRNGKMLSLQAVSRDITERKKVEDALKAAKEKAEEATKAKSQFLSMMSHEIRTPMNAIIGLTNIMMIDNPLDEQMDKLKLLKFSGDNLLTIINDILDFSKIEAGKIELEEVDFNLYESMENIVEMFKHRTKDSNLTIAFKYDEDLPKVIKGDQVRITQIITNLFGNAVKFTEKGNVTCAVKSLGIVEEKYKINFAITDTGIGIPADKIALIFESFSQAGSDTTRKFGGTGLGLSITKKLLQLMDSDIQVESEPGVGSTFSFTLNCKTGVEQSKAIVQSNLVEVLRSKAIKVLLVEDNRVNQIVATNFLKKWGIQTDIANNGLEALDRIVNKSYHLVLMDLQMPEMDGYEASLKIREMKGDPYFQQVPILALTASAMIEIKGKVIEMGMNDFISKPFKPEELQDKINTYALTEASMPPALLPM